jgi:tetratricopeptide (TPR) repeat protein
LLAAVSLCAHVETASCSGTVVLDSEKQFAFARDYFESGEYDKAIIEFERFIHFFPNDPKLDSALNLKGQVHFQLEQYAEAIESFGQHIRRNTDETGIAISPEIADSIWLASKSYEKLGQSDRSLAILHRLLAETDDPAIEDETHYRIGWIHIERDEWDKARKAFSTMTGEGRDRYNVPNLLSKLEEADEIPEKIPGLAGTLSLIPGAGYLYLGRYRDAATAFLLNAALIGATWEAFDNGNEILGGLLGVVEAGFYSGNIYGSVSSAHKYNRDQVQEFIDGLGSLAMGKKRHSSTGIQAFARRDRVGVMLRLRY